MKTLVRHGLAVCLALTTMCTSLLLVYSSLGGQKERPPAPATGSAQPAADSSPHPRLAAPAAPRPLDGYLGVADHQPSNDWTRPTYLTEYHLLYSNSNYLKNNLIQKDLHRMVQKYCLTKYVAL